MSAAGSSVVPIHRDGAGQLPRHPCVGGARSWLVPCQANSRKTPAVLGVSIRTTCTLDSRTNVEGEKAYGFLGVHPFWTLKKEEKWFLEKEESVGI